MAKNYSAERSLSGFPASVNCLRFGPLGDILAIGSDDGAISLVDFAQGITIFRLVAASPVTALHWQALFAGYGDGGVARLDTTKREGEHDSSKRTNPLGAHGVVEHLEYHESIGCLAVVMGKAVILCYISSSGSWDLMRHLPPPAPIHDDKSEEICPRSAHFSTDGKTIIVSYLKHGIWCLDVGSGETVWKITSRTPIGRTAFSETQNIIVACNLYDGFDCYSTTTRSLVHTFRTRITQNVPLPVQFIHGGSALLFGSACGDVSIWAQASHNWEDSLRHADTEIIQALDYTEVANRRYIATGLSEHAGDTSVHIWSSSKPRIATGLVSKPSRHKRVVVGAFTVILVMLAISLSTYATIPENDWGVSQILALYYSYVIPQAQRLTTSLATSSGVQPPAVTIRHPTASPEPPSAFITPATASTEPVVVFIELSSVPPEPSTAFVESYISGPITGNLEQFTTPLELSTVQTEPSTVPIEKQIQAVHPV